MDGRTLPTPNSNESSRKLEETDLSGPFAEASSAKPCPTPRWFICPNQHRELWVMNKIGYSIVL
jgi:hypothetical protein